MELVPRLRDVVWWMLSLMFELLWALGLGPLRCWAVCAVALLPCSALPGSAYCRSPCGMCAGCSVCLAYAWLWDQLSQFSVGT